MRKNLVFILIALIFVNKVNAQTIKPGVLVVGNGNAATAAAIQSAVSGVKTVLLLQAGGFDINLIGDDVSSGIELQFLEKLNKVKPVNAAFDKQLANEVLTKWTDSLKNLTVIKNIMWVKADRSGSHWSFRLSDGRTVKPKVLINPADEKLNQALKISPVASAGWAQLDYAKNNYRTSIAAGKKLQNTKASYFSLYQLLVPQQENLIYINDNQSMLIGQAAGATAAYAAFFDTKTSLSNLKTIQGELINYKLNLMPYADIKPIDTNWKAIQFVGITGVLKAQLDSVASFLPEKLVATEEIKQPIKDYFYKAQIWFDDYKNPEMTIGSTVDLVCYVGNKAPESTKKELEKKWKTKYQFKTELDYSRQINRREFAVILQDYMPPFNVNIDKEGKVIR